MDGQLLQQLQRELKAFEDRQLWALFELAVAEMHERGLFEDAALRVPPAPTSDNRGDLDEG